MQLSLLDASTIVSDSGLRMPGDPIGDLGDLSHHAAKRGVVDSCLFSARLIDIINQSLKQVFVTVGTTSFDELIEAADSDTVHQALATLGYTHVRHQVGRGDARPRAGDGDAAVATRRRSRLPTTWFDFAPSLSDFICSAELVISHAGAGSIMDALEARKPLVVVVNDALMDNHQAELAEVRQQSAGRDQGGVRLHAFRVAD